MTTSKLLFQLAFVLISSSLVHGSTSSTCNGVEGLCGFSVNEILYGMVHNAMSSPSHGFTIFPNHENDPLVASLDAGYRGISLDICRCNGQLVFCHGSSLVGCGVGSRDAVDTFAQIDDWLHSHPRDVVVFFLQINNGAGGGEEISLQEVESTLSDSFKSKLYQHNNQAWPTLGEMVENCKQILFFYTSGPNGNPPFGNPNGIHFFFDYASQTKFSHTTVESLQADPCALARSGTTQDFYLFNSFILANGIAASKTAAQIVNTGAFVEPILETCQATFNQPINFVAVDFWKQGDLPDFISKHNSGLVAKDATKAQVVISVDSCRPTTAAPTAAPTSSPTVAPTVPDSSASSSCSMRFAITLLSLFVLATI